MNSRIMASERQCLVDAAEKPECRQCLTQLIVCGITLLDKARGLRPS